MLELPHGARSQFVREYLSANPNSGAKQAVAALLANGIDVSESLVTKLKYRGRGAKRRSKARRLGAVAGAALPQAVASKSESIRDFLRMNPAAGPSEIRAGLRKTGVIASTGLISNVKCNLKQQAAAPTVRVAARKTRAAKTPAAKTPTWAGALTVEQLFAVRQFVETLGGANHVRTALDTLDQLR